MVHAFYTFIVSSSKVFPREYCRIHQGKHLTPLLPDAHGYMYLLIQKCSYHYSLINPAMKKTATNMKPNSYDKFYLLIKP